MFSIESFHKKYETDISNLTINDRKFKFFVPKTLDDFVDTEDVFNNFPLWAKIWEASIVLAEYLAGITADPKKHFLEIGGGMGISGIVASSFGHNVTVTEYNTDALNFAHANAKKNPAASDTKLKIEELDWNEPKLEGTFDVIFGSEIIYNDVNYQPIMELFSTFLKSDGEIILAERVREISVNFFSQINDIFDIKAQKRILRSKKEEIMVMLCRMKYR